ncbi:hypothetical protein O3M35_004056 [Rhynocoris fuscipes]|uniref:NADH dehydrogenase subunit 6 n=1 Tax=Rhynocoris fuscipes TaxID=488301 RepID=A0AAW1CI65_9HEMI
MMLSKPITTYHISPQPSGKLIGMMLSKLITTYHISPQPSGKLIGMMLSKLITTYHISPQPSGKLIGMMLSKPITTYHISPQPSGKLIGMMLSKLITTYHISPQPSGKLIGMMLSKLITTYHISPQPSASFYLTSILWQSLAFTSQLPCSVRERWKAQTRYLKANQQNKPSNLLQTKIKTSSQRDTINYLPAITISTNLKHSFNSTLLNSTISSTVIIKFTNI